MELCGSNRLVEARCGREGTEGDYPRVPPDGEVAQASDEGVLKAVVSG